MTKKRFERSNGKYPSSYSCLHKRTFINYHANPSKLPTIYHASKAPASLNKRIYQYLQGLVIAEGICTTWRYKTLMQKLSKNTITESLIIVTSKTLHN